LGIKKSTGLLTCGQCEEQGVLANLIGHNGKKVKETDFLKRQRIVIWGNQARHMGYIKYIH
jgi:hypothetical protein